MNPFTLDNDSCPVESKTRTSDGGWTTTEGLYPN